MFNFIKKKKYYKFNYKSLDVIDYKNVDLLRDYINDCNKIIPRRINNICAKYQRRIAISIKRARYLALLPYTDLHK